MRRRRSVPDLALAVVLLFVCVVIAWLAFVSIDAIGRWTAGQP
ncbi:MAG: hypothetical protein ACRDH7_07510 [Actinomycetota bacterium]